MRVVGDNQCRRNTVSALAVRVSSGDASCSTNGMATHLLKGAVPGADEPSQDALQPLGPNVRRRL